ncbi:MAG: hypothetical protein MI757_00300 [Pirellulales bacterium]|nr:hypothetical protein [Pirellulales bacterium]
MCILLLAALPFGLVWLFGAAALPVFPIVLIAFIYYYAKVLARFAPPGKRESVVKFEQDGQPREAKRVPLRTRGLLPETHPCGWRNSLAHGSC